MGYFFPTFPYFSLLFLTFSILWKDRKRKEKEQPQKKKEQPQEEKNRKRTEKKKTGAPVYGDCVCGMACSIPAFEIFTMCIAVVVALVADSTGP